MNLISHAKILACIQLQCDQTLFRWLARLMKNRGSSTYVIVAVYFSTFESLIVSRNTRRPCYISERAYSCHI